MLTQLQALAYQFTDPRKAALLINLLLIALLISGGGNNVPLTCPPGTSGSCGTGG